MRAAPVLLALVACASPDPSAAPPATAPPAPAAPVSAPTSAPPAAPTSAPSAPATTPPPAPATTPTATPSPKPAPAGAAFARATVDVPSPGAAAHVVDVRTGVHPGYERVVFELADRVPGYHVALVDQPVRRCGSGDAASVAGAAWLEVRLTPATAHGDDGRSSLGARSKEPTDTTVVRQLEQTCDFEADVTWVIGLAAPAGFRVQALTSPPRLVIDVEAKGAVNR